MKTAQEILKSHTKGMMSEMRIINAMKEYATEVAREALRNASEVVYNKFNSSYKCKNEILNESNIPKL